MRITVLRESRRFVAQGNEDCDPGSRASIQAAAERVCSAQGKRLPSPAIVRVEERMAGGRHREVAEEQF